MQNRLSIIVLQILVLLGILFSSGAIHAFQMGEVNSQSRIGEPLKASVSLWMSPKDKLQPIRFKISPDLSYISNTKLSAVVNRMEARFVQGPKGSSYVSISTSSPIMEPIVAFRLKVYVGDEVRMRNFALTPSPATRPPRAAVTRARPSGAITPRSTIDGPTYTVISGDTLWGIAQRVGRTNNAETANLVTEIFAGNPHAFANGNQNQLMLGAQLSLPGAGATIADATSSDTPVSTTSPIEPSPGARGETDLFESDAEPIAVASAPRSPVRWQERKPELAAELEALKQKYAALKARYDLNSSQALASEIVAPTTTAMVDVAPNATSELQAAEESPTVEPEALPEVDQVQSETPAISASSATSADPVVTNEDVGMAAYLQSLSSFWASVPLLLILGSICAIFALIVLYRLTRKVVVTQSARRAERRHNSLEEERKAEVTAKAKNRVEMEGEVKRMLDGRGDSPTPSTPEHHIVAAGAVEMPQKPATKEAAIDMNIAHGRYAEAETLLAEVIATSPRNYSAKLRLIEVFYMTERIKEFCQLAEDLHQNHRADMADEEWQRVVRMGKIIAPEQSPFSGPRAVSNPTQAS